MNNEIIESVGRCRMDIQELKGMMKMHFRDDIHHNSPCHEVKKLHDKIKITSILMFALCFLCAVMSVNSYINSVNLRKINDRQNDICIAFNKTIDDEQKMFLKIRDVFLNHKEAIDLTRTIISNEVMNLMDVGWRMNCNIREIERNTK